MMRCDDLRTYIWNWRGDYVRIQSSAVILLFVQIGCALIGSLGASFNGVSLANLGIALFALVAIESSSERLGRTYAVLLFFAILLDISWLILFSHEIWTISSETYGTFVTFSLKLTLSMQIIGFCVRLSSSLLWIQMYKLGASYVDNPNHREGYADLNQSFLNPATPSIVRQPSGSDEVLGGSICDPSYYSSLFGDGRDEAYFSEAIQNHDTLLQSTTTEDVIQMKSSMGRSVCSMEAGSVAAGNSLHV